MINEWSLQKEIINASQRWPVIIVYCLTGCLIGWSISFGWPSPHRATKELYVGLNIQRISQDINSAEYAGVQFNNVDDYKNWQMASLNSLIFMDDVIDETLSQLEKKDSHWQNISRDELVEHLHAYWRNAGKWRLVAESEDLQFALQAITVWQDVVIKKVHDATTASHEALEINRQIESIVTAKTLAIKQSAMCNQTIEAIIHWQQTTSHIPFEQILTNSERDSLWIIANRPELGSSVSSILKDFPTTTASLKEYNVWIEKFLLSLNWENLILQKQIETLEKEHQHLALDYAETSRRSLGLSPDLIVDNIADDYPEQSVTRPTSLLILIGGFMGLILWAIIWMAKISLQVES